MNKTEEELTYSQIRYRKIKADPKLMKKRREINNKYEKSEKGKEAKKRWRRTIKGKMLIQKFNMKYKNNPIRKKQLLKASKIQNDSTRNRTNQRKRWTEDEIKLIWNTSLTTMEIAEKLERSRHAVETARCRYWYLAPKDYKHNGSQRIDYSGQMESQ